MSQTREDFHAIRKTGIGGSEVAAIVGLDPNRDKFSVYAEKLGLIDRMKPTGRMRWGKLLERAIVSGYSEDTGLATEWCDETHRNAARPWQLSTPDAYVFVDRDTRCGVDAKNISHDQAWRWGDPGTDDVPTTIALQLQWYCSAEETPWWDAAALFGGHDLRIYRIWRDADIESVILEEVESFWRNHVEARVQPALGFSQAAADYLKQRFPKSITPLRVATVDERELISQVKAADRELAEIEKDHTALENALKLAIGDAEGIIDGKDKITYRRCRDTLGTDWAAVAEDLIREVAERTVEAARVPELMARIRREQIGKHGITLKEGSRRLNKSWTREKQK